MKGNKGQLSGFPGTVMIIISALVFLAVGFYLVQEFLNLDSLSEHQASVTNEREGSINSTGYFLAGANVSGANTFSITDAVNSTNGVTIASGNWTISSTGQVTNATYEKWNNVTFNYTYNYGREAYLGVNQTMDSFGEIPGLLSITILVIMIGLVMVILLGIGKKSGVGA